MGRLDGKVALISDSARGQWGTETRFMVREGAISNRARETLCLITSSEADKW